MFIYLYFFFRKCDRFYLCSNCVKCEGFDVNVCFYVVLMLCKKGQNQGELILDDM